MNLYLLLHSNRLKKFAALSLLRPGPRSYKLALIKTIENLHDNSNEKADAKMTPPVIDLIEVSDSDEENEADDDIQVIGDCRKQMPGKRFDMIYGVVNGGGNQEESSDKNVCLVDISKEIEKQIVLVMNLEVVSASGLRSMKEPSNNVDQITLRMKMSEKEKMSCTYKSPQNRLSSSAKTFAQNLREEISSLDCKPNKKKKANKSSNPVLESCSHDSKVIKRLFDDEVIILSD